MGCSFFQDPLVSGVLDKLKKEATTILEVCLKDRGVIEAEKQLKISERHSTFATLFNEKKEITEDQIKEFNRQEFSIDKKLVLNEVNKTQKLYGVGKSLADELKQGLIDKFTNELRGAPSIAQAAIKAKIQQLTSYSNVQFLQSSFGKPLLKALESYGVSRAALEKYVKDISDATKKRREEERKEFGISRNEFDDDYSEKMLMSLTDSIIAEITAAAVEEAVQS